MKCPTLNLTPTDMSWLVSPDLSHLLHCNLIISSLPSIMSVSYGRTLRPLLTVAPLPSVLNSSIDPCPLPHHQPVRPLPNSTTLLVPGWSGLRVFVTPYLLIYPCTPLCQVRERVCWDPLVDQTPTDTEIKDPIGPVERRTPTSSETGNSSLDRPTRKVWGSGQRKEQGWQ